MAKKKAVRRSFDEDFKIKAVKMMTEDGMTGAQVEKKLKVKAAQLYQWKSKYAGSKKTTGAEISTKGMNVEQLRKELAAVTEERDYLRKAISIVHARLGL